MELTPPPPPLRPPPHSATRGDHLFFTLINAAACPTPQAYRQLAKQMHPDKMHTASGEEKSAAHDRFVDINAAFAVLSDVSTRRK
jgi:hypothetical protein